MKRYLTGFLLGMISTTILADEHRLSAGANVGFTHISNRDVNEIEEVTDDSLSGAGYGGTFRYTQITDSGFLVGLQFNGAIETASTDGGVTEGFPLLTEEDIAQIQQLAIAPQALAGSLQDLGLVSTPEEISLAVDALGLGALGPDVEQVTNEFTGELERIWQGVPLNAREGVLRTPTAVSATLRGAIENKWSADFLARVGRDFGRVSAYIGGGPSLSSVKLTAELTASVDNAAIPDDVDTNLLMLSGSSEKTLLGFKLIAGLDIDVTDNTLIFLQGEFSQYGKETFQLAGFDLNTGKTKNYNARVGFLYRFF